MDCCLSIISIETKSRARKVFIRSDCMKDINFLNLSSSLCQLESILSDCNSNLIPLSLSNSISMLETHGIYSCLILLSCNIDSIKF